MSTRVQGADVKNVLRSAREVNFGGTVEVLGGERSYEQNKSAGRETRANYEEGQRVVYLWVPSKEEEVREESEKVPEGNRFAVLATESGEVSTQRA